MFRPHQENLNIVEMVMFCSCFASKLLGYVELNCIVAKLASQRLLIIFRLLFHLLAWYSICLLARFQFYCRDECLYPDNIYHRHIIYSITIITSPLLKIRFFMPFQTLTSNLIFDSHNCNY